MVNTKAFSLQVEKRTKFIAEKSVINSINLIVNK